MGIWRNGNPCALLAEYKIGQFPRKIVWGLLKKLNRTLPWDPAILLLGLHPQRTESRVSERDVHTRVHGSIIHSGQRWKQPIGPSMDKRLNKMGRAHSRECNSALQRKGIQTPAPTWRNFEPIMLREASQPQRDAAL